MGLLDDVMANDSAALVDTDAFGESVTYTMGIPPGTTRTINGIIDRMPPAKALTPDIVELNPILVEVRNHATLGVDPTLINLKKDTLTFPTIHGSSGTVARLITKIVRSDAGTVLLAVVR